jgi:uncharacterized glyoxalase superfamily protein PhnB
MNQALFAYLCVTDAAAAIDFYRRAFGAVEIFRLDDPATGRVAHAEVEIGGSTLMLAEEYPQFGLRAPNSLGATTVTLHLHVDDCDAAAERAVSAGGVLESPPENQPHGERQAVVRDPSGHRWNIGQHLEELSPEEMQRRYSGRRSAEPD